MGYCLLFILAQCNMQHLYMVESYLLLVFLRYIMQHISYVSERARRKSVGAIGDQRTNSKLDKGVYMF